jgi:hypothetical protein
MVNETLAYPFPGRIRDGTSSGHSRRRRARKNRDWMNVSVLTPICNQGRPDPSWYGNLILKTWHGASADKRCPKALTESCSRQWKMDAKEAGY